MLFSSELEIVNCVSSSPHSLICISSSLVSSLSKRYSPLGIGSSTLEAAGGAGRRVALPDADGPESTRDAVPANERLVGSQ
jgi:hypothetical protein